MENKITSVFTKYIKDKELTQDNIYKKLQEMNYINFFNEITVNILGKPTYTHDKCTKTSQALTYIAESAEDRFIKNINILSINSMYQGSITRLNFNYDNYHQLLEQLINLRKKMKKSFLEDNNSEANLIQILIKSYVNLVYGMIDNSMSVLTSSNEKPREFVIENSKKAILSITAFLINKQIPVYYIDSDEIHCGDISQDNFMLLQEYYSTVTEEFIDTKVSKLDKNSDGFINGYYKSKNKFMLSEKTRMRGIKEVDIRKVKLDNKKYFGEIFPFQFPEYAI
jgi:hypothetical protein